MHVTQRRWSRRAALLVPLAACALFASPPASADAAAEAFVAGILDEANPVFEAAEESARFAGIDALVDKYVDMRRVSMFVLGQYARVITDEQKARYHPLFTRYARMIYRDALSVYSGQRLEVVNSVDRTPKDIIVNTRVIGARPGDDLADVTVHWRVYRGEDGKEAIFDAGANQVWLAIEQQSQFKSVIANNGGGTKGIDALIESLEEKVGG